jgi:hypothetical protein
MYRSSNSCGNTGEIAAVLDHEYVYSCDNPSHSFFVSYILLSLYLCCQCRWGHGMDANDVNGGIAKPSGEGIADVYAALRLGDSCIGRNFFKTKTCGGCTTCTGVRDIDYEKRDGFPHDFTWSNNNCGGKVHCVGGVYSEAVWSLYKRILQTAPYNYDDNTALEITTRLTYIAAGNGEERPVCCFNSLSFSLLHR